MKKILQISFILLALLISINTFAQRGSAKGDPEARATKMTAHLTEALELSDEQATKIKAIHLKYGERIQALREQGDRDKTRAAMQQMRADIDSEIKQVLTAEQAAKFEEMPKYRKGKRGKGKRASKEQRQAMQQIKEEKILPLLLEQRAQLDTKLSDTDKARLVELRTEVEEKRTAMKAERKERHEAMKKEGRPGKEERKQLHEERKERHTAMKNDPLHQEIEAMVMKYQSDIESLLAEVEPQIKAIKEEAKSQNKEMRNKEGKEGKKYRRGHGKHKGKGDWSEADKEEFKANKKMRHQAHFLLLDPNGPSIAEKTALVTGVKVYPNPSLGESQLEYTLKSAGLVTVELHDKSGNLLKVIEKANQPAGTNNTTINFASYSTGVYFVVVKDANGKAISTKVIR